MKNILLAVLRCPQTGQTLQLERLGSDAVYQPLDEIESGWLVSEDGRNRYPIRDGIPRFVPESNYADNFGMQWNLFSKTQLDSRSGYPISANRFWRATKWKPEELRGQWVLDAGCGAGRFAEIALQAGAKVLALDYSSAVDACYANLRQYHNLYVIQADIYHIHLQTQFFSFVYCLGVLQHTPDVHLAFVGLPRMLAHGGRIVVDVYEKSRLRMILSSKYLVRPLTKRLPKSLLFRILQKTVPPMFAVSNAAQQIPLIGPHLRRLVPVANNMSMYPLSYKQHLEWALLDTFDWYSPQYDQPQSADSLREWLIESGLTDIEVEKAGHLVGRGVAKRGSS